jgi:hypothetical protein
MCICLWRVSHITCKCCIGAWCLRQMQKFFEENNQKHSHWLNCCLFICSELISASHAIHGMIQNQNEEFVAICKQHRVSKARVLMFITCKCRIGDDQTSSLFSIDTALRIAHAKPIVETLGEI